MCDLEKGFLCLQTLEGMWRPILPTTDPVYWERVLHEAPLHFITTEKLREIYSPYEPSSLSELGRQGIFLKGEKARELINLFLSKGAQPSQEDIPVGGCAQYYRKLSCGTHNLPYFIKHREKEWNPKLTGSAKPIVCPTVRRALQKSSSQVMNPVNLQHMDPLSRLFPLQMSAGCPQQGGQENKAPRAPQGDSLLYPPGIFLSSPKQQETRCTASNLYREPCPPHAFSPQDQSSSFRHSTPNRPPGFAAPNASGSGVYGAFNANFRFAGKEQLGAGTCNRISTTSVQETAKYLPPHMRGK